MEPTTFSAVKDFLTAQFLKADQNYEYTNWNNRKCFSFAVKMNTRKKYDTSVVFLYRTGNEHLLPREFRKQIPYTTISSWRRADYRHYMGHEYRGIFNEAFSGAEVRLAYHKIKNHYALSGGLYKLGGK